ncbi:ribosomal subunit interface protein [Candidatus Nomurabacteria bacterium RIFCSPLOWO2_01_FULL_39_18]|uniref:Ribosomal subunit interface protein n=1 Tax=Candidatus Nomurabacteria bacterium RIFCSPHIGHO2_01_FULL_40_24b TaxID=1801739 RepID=A0A1F6V641_9BACT|nr:MAG: ribosomal subunit interface protein [Candidatus Nomurabacteria bacterium RIFCSPHIGHO2_01_FULL_40_24b]OGI89324.1 MAG: ribosomal subunit interface protein [Candidatus Nomurabacteria bacterium RIFCSPLOWO2_01_FULL_39_18]
MQINLQGKNMELTEAIKGYVLNKETTLGRLLEKAEEAGGEVAVSFEVSKATNHHKSGSVFHADCLINLKGEKFYGSADEEDLYQAIDKVKENLFREITKNKDRRQTLFKRGAASVKKMLKGLSKRNPFTSKY